MPPRGRTSDSLHLAYVDQSYTTELAAKTADHSLFLDVLKLPGAGHGFMLLSRGPASERLFPWMVVFAVWPVTRDSQTTL